MNSNAFRHNLWIALLFLPIIVHLGCLERRNPWDPIHGCPQSVREEIIERSKLQLKSYVDSATVSFGKIKQQLIIVSNLEHVNDSIKDVIDKAEWLADSVVRKNEIIESENRTTECKSLLFKNSIPLIHPFTPFSNVSEVNELRSSIENFSNNSKTIFFQDNNECQPFGIHPDNFQDSVMNLFSTKLDSTDSIVKQIELYNFIVTDTDISLLNTRYTATNDLIKKHNDSIADVKSYCGRIWLSDIQSIKLAVDSIMPGDTLRLDSGSLTLDLNFFGKGDSTQPIIVEGSPFSNTILNQTKSIFKIDSCSNIIIRNITFTNGENRNFEVQRSKQIYINNCNFLNSRDGIGIDIINSSVTIEKSTFIGNKFGINNTGLNGVLNASNVLIVQNSSHGLQNLESQLNLSYATISDNGETGIHLVNPKNTVYIVNTLLTHNNGYGLFKQRSENDNRTFMFNTAFFNNTMGNFSPDTSSMSIDPSCKTANPAYIDKDNLNYTIGTTSELYSTEIGYKP